MIHVIWHKRDLRIVGNKAVAIASDNDATLLPIYCFEPHLVNTAEISQQHIGFISESLQCLNTQYRELDQNSNVGLLQSAGEILELLQALKETLGCFKLYSNQETTHQAGFDRDKAVRTWCELNEIQWIEVEQNGVRRGSILRTEGPLSFKEHIKQSSLREPLFKPTELKLYPIDKLRSLFPKTKIQLSGQDKPGRLRGGREAMLTRLYSMLRPSNLMAYPSGMSSPVTASEVCSRLSAYLAYGVLSDQELFCALNLFIVEHLAQADEPLSKALQFFSERLYWRHAYLQQAETRPNLAHESYFPALDYDRQNHHFEPWFEAWTQGNTGIPIVDAVMRWLNHTGWINMRMRGMTASFALNSLWLDRQWVSSHLAKSFLDFEPAIHHAQIAIHAGCHKSEPLIYDTLKQSKTLDPQGEFIKAWVPELKEVPVLFIHEPHKMSSTQQQASHCQIGQDYPEPIVDPTAAYVAGRDRVLSARQGKPIEISTYWKALLHKREQNKNQGSLF